MSQNHHNNIEGVVEKIAREHFELDESLEKIIWFKPDDMQEINLLEINPITPATGDVMSFYFPPSTDVPYDLYLAEVTPQEWQRVLQSEIPMSEGWSLKNFKELVRETVTA
jgi:hypothetical protein